MPFCVLDFALVTFPCRDLPSLADECSQRRSGLCKAEVRAIITSSECNFHFHDKYPGCALPNHPIEHTPCPPNTPKSLKNTETNRSSDSWDDWVPQDRLRKLTDDNRELAANLRRELVQQSAPKAVPKSTGKTRRGQGSEIGSGRGSEERTSSVPAAGGRGSKRARDNDIEKVRGTRSRRSDVGDPLFRENLLAYLGSLDTRETFRYPEPFGYLLGLNQDIKATSALSDKVSAPTNPEASDLEALEDSKDSVPLNSTSSNMDSSKDNNTLYHGDSCRKIPEESLSQFLYVRRSVAAKAAQAVSSASSKKTPSAAESAENPIKMTKGGATKRKDREHQSKRLRVKKGINYEGSEAQAQDSEAETISAVLQSAHLSATNTCATSNAKIPKFTAPQSSTSFASQPPTPVPTNPYPERYPRRMAQRSSPARVPLQLPRIVHNLDEYLGKRDSRLDKTVDEILAEPAPPDELEYISKLTANEKPQQFWAPLIGGATIQEKQLIEEELEAAGIIVVTPKYHPQYAKARTEKPPNFNRELFFEAQEPTQRLAIAGVPKDPLVIDPPGSGGSFDALKFPDRLVEQLNRDDKETLYGWDEEALMRISKPCMARLYPHILAKMPYDVLVKQPNFILDKLPDDAPFWNEYEAQAAYEFAQKAEAETARKTRNSARDCVESVTEIKGQAKPSLPVAISQPDQKKCLNYKADRANCSGEEPACSYCRRQGFLCSYRVKSEPPKDRCSTCITNGVKCNGDKPICFSCRCNRLPCSFDSAQEGKKRLADFISPESAAGTSAYNCLSQQEENFYNRPSIRISIPDNLKNLLVDDWENVTKSLLLVPLPSQAPANYILDEYFNEEKTNRRLGSAEADILEEFVIGLKQYFEKAVGKILLYRFERSQLADVSYFLAALSV